MKVATIIPALRPASAARRDWEGQMKITGIERISDGPPPPGGAALRAPFDLDVQTPDGAGLVEVSFEAATQLIVELSRAINARGITLGEPRR